MLTRMVMALLFCTFCNTALAGDPPLQLRNEGTNLGVVFNLDCVGDGITCTKSGIVGTIGVAGGGGSVNTSGYVPKSNGSAFVDSSIYDNGNVGIGTISPASILNVVGDGTATLILNSVPSGSVTIEQTAEDSNFQLGDVSNVEYRPGQTFTLASSATITGASIKLGANTGSPTGNITISLQTLAAGLPTGTLVHANATSTITPTPSAVNTVSYTPFSLAAGTYAFVVQCDNQATNARFNVRYKNSNVYAGGNLVYYMSNTGLWNTSATQDMYFSVITSSTANPKIQFQGSTTNKWSILSNGSDSDKLNIENGTTRIAIDANGNTGINTTAPVNKLQVSGNVAIGTTMNGLICSADSLCVGGNVGIGTQAPVQKLQVIGSVQATGYVASGNVGITTTAPTTCGCKQYTNGLCTMVGTCT